MKTCSIYCTTLVHLFKYFKHKLCNISELYIYISGARTQVKPKMAEIEELFIGRQPSPFPKFCISTAI